MTDMPGRQVWAGRTEWMRIWCGIDWAERHHDIALVDDEGKLVAKRRITDDAAGFRTLLALLADHGAGPEQPVPIAMETSRGLLAAALLGAGYPLYPINPLAVARYRDRYSVSRAKSDAGDAFVLANILRTDREAHRPLPADSELAAAVRVLARAQQDAVWDRQQIANKLRSLLREYFPTALTAFGDLAQPVAVEVLLLAPTPTTAAKLTVPRIRAALRRAGRQRNLDAAASTILTSLRGEQLHQPPLIEAAMGEQATGLLRSLSTALTNLTRLDEALTAAFNSHPDARIITSMPGLGPVLGARMLAEIGDDRERFTDARGLKAFAGTAPVTRASGTKTVVSARIVRNKRLGQVGYLWALSLLTTSPGARAHYDRRRDRGDNYSAAARNLANRYLGILYHCLHTGQTYDESKAFPHMIERPERDTTEAA
jgi:transposase